MPALSCIPGGFIITKVRGFCDQIAPDGWVNMAWWGVSFQAGQKTCCHLPLGLPCNNLPLAWWGSLYVALSWVAFIWLLTQWRVLLSSFWVHAAVLLSPTNFQHFYPPCYYLFSGPRHGIRFLIGYMDLVPRFGHSWLRGRPSWRVVCYVWLHVSLGEQMAWAWLLV